MEKVKGEQKKSPKKLKLKRDGTVLEKTKEVGYIIYDVTKESDKAHILKSFATEKKVIESIKKIRFPKKFTFVWVNKFYVKLHKRGKGYGSDILQTLQEKFKDQKLVIGLSPGYLVKTTDIKRLLPFYKRQGFKLISTPTHHYGFKVVK